MCYVTGYQNNISPPAWISYALIWPECGNLYSLNFGTAVSTSKGPHSGISVSAVYTSICLTSLNVCIHWIVMQKVVWMCMQIAILILYQVSSRLVTQINVLVLTVICKLINFLSDIPSFCSWSLLVSCHTLFRLPPFIWLRSDIQCNLAGILRWTLVYPASIQNSLDIL
jgi:hypothetical protein